jgi:hypothetical protein
MSMLEGKFIANEQKKIEVVLELVCNTDLRNNSEQWINSYFYSLARVDSQ